MGGDLQQQKGDYSMKAEKRYAVLSNKRTASKFADELSELIMKAKTLKEKELSSELYDFGYRVRNEHSIFPMPDDAADADYDIQILANVAAGTCFHTRLDTEKRIALTEFFYKVIAMEGCTTWSRVGEQTDMYILQSASSDGEAGRFVINNEIHTVWDISSDESYNSYQVRRHEEAGI